MAENGMKQIRLAFKLHVEGTKNDSYTKAAVAHEDLCVRSLRSSRSRPSRTSSSASSNTPRRRQQAQARQLRLRKRFDR